MAFDVATLRALLRNLQAFRSLYETEGIDTLVDPDGFEWTLWDLMALYRALPKLPSRQHQAIELCFVQNMKEADAARKMGVSYTNPVSIYANNGLSKLIGMVRSGQVDGFKIGLRETMVKITIDIRVEHHEADAREEGDIAADQTRDPLALRRGGQPVDPGVTPGGDQTQCEGRHPHPMEGSRQAS